MGSHQVIEVLLSARRPGAVTLQSVGLGSPWVAIAVDAVAGISTSTCRWMFKRNDQSRRHR
jgi:hypothetical protein